MVHFTWDERKSDANRQLRGFDFSFATLVFDGRHTTRQDIRREYGEIRMIAVGLADGRQLTVVYTDRPREPGIERRIISARRSSRRERLSYEQAFQSEPDAEPRPR